MDKQVTGVSLVPLVSLRVHSRQYEPTPKPKGQESLAQGLPVLIRPPALALQGPSCAARIGPEPLSRIECTF
jgi:hypothetical protein